MNRYLGIAVTVLVAAVVLATAGPALAFDRGPHTEITTGAMVDEGFGSDASGVVQVNNWFVDLYHELSAIKMPHSGAAPWYLQVVTGVIRQEDWSDALIGASTRMHFDDNPGARPSARRPDLNNTAGITAEWDRLRKVTWALVQEARERNDPLELLTVLGATLHPVQDFYAHTNWIEPLSGRGVPGSDGPGWQERGFGSNPTWFDVPAEQRNKYEVYGDSTPGHSRIHGLWNADGNTSLTTGMNKDWPGRPYHLQAAITAYFASRQWIEAVRSWVNDDAFWERAQHYQAVQGELHHDLEGMFKIMLYSGHWQGEGEPIGGGAHGLAGSLLDLTGAVREYFQPGTSPVQPGTNPLGSLEKTRYRARFESLIERIAAPEPVGKVEPVPSSQDLQRAMRIVVLRIPKIEGEGLGDPGPDDADMFARVRINGQGMASSVIHGKDKFTFPNPYEPFTWFKAIPAVPDEQEPVESVEVQIHTADASWAGTDDDVFLRLGPKLRFELDKRLYNDFERDDRDTYSVPIDNAAWNGMRVGDIDRVRIEKSSDGIAGGWKLGGVKLRVNGQQVYDNQNINRWLEDDHRTWEAPNFVRRDPHGTKIPVAIYLGEDDSVYGEDDEGDINPYDHRDIASIGYEPGTDLKANTKGGNSLGGRLGYGGDGASIAYHLETLTPTLMGGIGAPPNFEPGPEPDLIITEFNINHITVMNQGEGDAGPFHLLAAGGGMQFDGLPAGASETRLFPGNLNCNGNYFAFVDDLRQIEEADETNNMKASEPVIC